MKEQFMEIIQLDIKGMTCASCVAHVEKGIAKAGGVDSVSVNLATEKATVSYDPDQIDIDRIIHSVEESGYGASPVREGDGEDPEKKKAFKRLRNHTVISLILSAPLLLAMFAGLLKIEALMFLHIPLVQLLLATPVQFWIGWRFYKGAFLSLKAGSPGMDVLVALGTSAAYFFSIFNGFFAERLGLKSPGLYFEASSIIISLVLLGKFLEGRAKGKTSEAIKKLMGLQPKTARVQREGEWMEIPIADVSVGDRVQIKPGERIPVDGQVLEGESALDESSLTGESMPVEKKSGDIVLSGSINSYGSFIFQAEKVGKDSVLSRIIAVVEEAQGSKAPIQKLADKVAAVFVPVVLAIALLTFLLWWFVGGEVNQAIISAVAVLVIACPCALGLATPTAIMVGTGVGAQRGILIKNGEILQQAGKVDAVVLDKTGTVTRGRPELQQVISLEGSLSEEEILQLAASVEILSEHPLARAVVDAARDKGLELLESSGFQAQPGKGIEAQLGQDRLLVGTEAWLKDQGFSLETVLKEKRELENKGQTVIILARSGGAGKEVLGLLAIADSIKEYSVQGIEALKALGLEVHMITGDNRRTAEAIAAQAGIEHVFAEVLPEGKAEKVKALQEKGYRVAMAGDGINDAPALATADVGIAMGEGSDIAMESADITLMRGDLREIAASVHLSRRTMAKIRQNLFWAFFYNAIGIPFAALGFLNPIIAGAAMAFSSVSVVSNSLSLRRFKPVQKGASAEDPKQEVITSKEVNMTTMKVEGMTCNHCKMHVEKAASSVEGVLSAEVNLDKKELSMQIEEGKDPLEAVKEAVKEAGYTPV